MSCVFWIVNHFFQNQMWIVLQCPFNWRLHDKFISRLKWISFENMWATIYFCIFFHFRMTLFLSLCLSAFSFIFFNLRYYGSIESERQKFAVPYQKFKFAIATHAHTHIWLAYWQIKHVLRNHSSIHTCTGNFINNQNWNWKFLFLFVTTFLW